MLRSISVLFIEAGLASEDPQVRSGLPIILPRELGTGRHVYHLFRPGFSSEMS